MTNLLRAHFARLWKSKLYWLCLVASYIMGIAFCNSALGSWAIAENYSWGSELWGQPLCGFGLVCGILCAAFFSLFFGVEYGDKTVRNKVIAGHRRTEIYLSVLVVSVGAALLLYLASLVNMLLRLDGMRQIPLPDAGQAAMALAGTALLIVAVCSICTMFCMLVHKRAVLAVVLILLMVVLFAVSLQVEDLYQTVTAEGMEMYVGPDGPEFIWHEAQGAGPTLTFLYNFLPVNQAYRYMELDATPVMLAYTTLLTAVTTAAGLFCFKRKNIM